MEQEENWRITNCRRCLNRFERKFCRDCSHDPKHKNFYKHYRDKKGIK